MSSHHFSKKLVNKIEKPFNVGIFSVEEAKARQMRLAIGKSRALNAFEMVQFFLLVDEEDGVIVEARFQALGSPELIGAADAVCNLMIRKNYDQAQRISADLVDKHLRDRSDQPAFPKEADAILNLILEAIEDAANACTDIPFAETYVASPVEAQLLKEGESYPHWLQLSVEHQLAIIEEVVANEIRPYIELDAGGIKILNLISGLELIIAYEGSCTTCYSATGSTLNAIQQILRARIHPEIRVIPDGSFLQAQG